MEQLKLTAAGLEDILKPMVDAAVRRTLETHQSTNQPHVPFVEAARTMVGASSPASHNASGRVHTLTVVDGGDPVPSECGRPDSLTSVQSLGKSDPICLDRAPSDMSSGGIVPSASFVVASDTTASFPPAAPTAAPLLRSVSKRSTIRTKTAPTELPISALPENTNILLSFSNRNDAVQAAWDSAAVWSSPSPDPTVPTSDEERQEYVLGLLAAMMNRENCGNVGRKGKRWQIDQIHYSQEAMEKVCWDILDLAERLHTIGPRCLSIYDPAIEDRIIKERMLTFGERIEYIIKLLALYKSRCEDLMKGSALDETVATPQYKLRCAAQNMTNNKFKGRLISKGRKAAPSDDVLAGDDDQNGNATVASANVDGNSEEEVDMAHQQDSPILGAREGDDHTSAEYRREAIEDPCVKASPPSPHLTEDDTQPPAPTSTSKRSVETTSDDGTVSGKIQPEAKRPRVE